MCLPHVVLGERAYAYASNSVFVFDNSVDAKLSGGFIADISRINRLLPCDKMV